MQTSDPRTLQPWAVDYSVVVGAVAREAQAWNVLHVLKWVGVSGGNIWCAPELPPRPTVHRKHLVKD